MSQSQIRTTSGSAELAEPVIPNSDPLLGMDAWSEFTEAKQRFLMRLEAQSREFRLTGPGARSVSGSIAGSATLTGTPTP